MGVALFSFTVLAFGFVLTEFLPGAGLFWAFPSVRRSLPPADYEAKGMFQLQPADDYIGSSVLSSSLWSSSSSPYYRYCLKRHKEGVEENKLLSVCSRFDQAKTIAAKVFTCNEEFVILPAQSKSSWAPWTLQVSLHGKVNWKKQTGKRFSGFHETTTFGQSGLRRRYDEYSHHFHLKRAFSTHCIFANKMSFIINTRGQITNCCL